MEVLSHLEPKEVFYYFEEISQIPRGSGNEKEISDYLVNFAKSHGLDVIQDSSLNVIIKKPGTKGYENAPTVIIQGHMDMVCEKNKGTEHDFEKDPLKLRIEGDNVFATGTTLGADNGIAVAYALAILSSKEIVHPPLEVLITSDEEAGMGGAMNLSPEHISGKILLNLDSEEEGFLLVSCAGGIRNKAVLNIEWEAIKSDVSKAEVKVRGLKGGHSGMEINKERGNSNKIMGRVLKSILEEVDFNLVATNGGSKNNAIPREHDSLIVFPSDKLEVIKEKISTWNQILSNEFKAADPDVKIEFELVDTAVEKVFSKNTTRKAVELLYLLPNGIDTMSMDIPGLVQSSTNLGVVTTFDTSVEYDSATRSSVGSLKDEIIARTKNIAEIIGAEFETSADYPEWQYNPESKIRTICQEVYKTMTGKEPEILAIHAGLECGLFTERLGADIDMISFGPNLYDVHTPNEHMSITSVKNLWDYLLNVLKEIK
ncbi:aminoacyl-histidine dipeptidase [Clostridium folliculivorans]|uniref:Cytosol non-specific dipeptidase n=1 Tax=Clostridium folliculivorans TaxID=2886038 RepID=A0A9W5XYN9_9CLOT|nr:aminoacyl-histidine dipeptidase [Clostridium folliculivorans]GKU23377.1 aminoacyl-histidine dipeptidase [Clostridium folliculivorans]GKU29494.1 aminoacyl-histidine dipeptidase [Clostridium folliculivorans]